MTQNSIVKEKALVGAFSVIMNLRMDLRFKLYFLLFEMVSIDQYLQYLYPPGAPAAC